MSRCTHQFVELFRVLLNSDQKVFGSMKQNCASLDGSKGIDLRTHIGCCL